MIDGTKNIQKGREFICVCVFVRLCDTEREKYKKIER